MNQYYGPLNWTMVKHVVLWDRYVLLALKFEGKNYCLIVFKNQSKKIGNPTRVIALSNQVTLKKLINLTHDYWPHQNAIGFGKETEKITLCKTIVNACTYACAPHKVQLKWTHYQTIAKVKNMRLKDYHQCMYYDWETCNLLFLNECRICQSTSSITWINIKLS